MQNFTSIKKHFFRDLKFLEGVSTFVGKIDLDFSDNQDLVMASKRLTVPKVFTPFVRIMERIVGKIDTDFQFTKKEVLESDLEAAERFSRSSFEFKGINLDYLFTAALTTATEMGILSYRRPILKLDPSKDIIVKTYVVTKDDGTDEVVQEDMPITKILDTYRINTSAGYPTFAKKGSELARIDAASWLKRFLLKPSLSKILTQPAAIFHRFQFRVGPTGELSKKIRQVWALPFRVLSLQAYMFRDLQNFCIKFARDEGNIVSPWGLKGNPEISREIIRRFRLLQSVTGADIVSLDVQKFDSNVPSWMYALFGSVVKLVFPREEHDLIDKVLAYECFTPYVLDTGELKFQQRGIPSGSLLTQLFGTFVTRTVVNYAFLEYTKGKSTAGIYSNCLGDDNLTLLSTISYSHLLSVYKRFELPIEVNKTRTVKPGKPFSYLGPTWDEECRPTQPLEWFIARFACPARYYVRPAFTIPYFQTYRCLATIMPYFGGLKIFEELVGKYDQVYLSLLELEKEGKRTIVPITDDSGEIVEQYVPLDRIRKYDWLAFDPEITVTDPSLEVHSA